MPADLQSKSDMNENLNERFGRGKAVRDSHLPRTPPSAPVTLNSSIRNYAKTAEQPVDLSHWTSFRDIPSSNEVFDEGRLEHGTTLELAENTVVGPYLSKEEYLESHYRLLREDAVAPLRDVVSEIQLYPQLMEKDSDNGAYIYEKVRDLQSRSIHLVSSCTTTSLIYFHGYRSEYVNILYQLLGIFQLPLGQSPLHAWLLLDPLTMKMIAHLVARPT